MRANNSFEGIGQWAATFVCQGVEEGQLVKISENGAVAACAAGEDFCGRVLAVGRDGAACSVALGGMVTTPYTGTAPALGWSGLAADGSGGVKTADSGRKHLVADVDETGNTVTFVL